MNRVRGRIGFALALALASLVGCLQFDGFSCLDDPQCNSQGGAGTCEEPGYCAFPDDGCPSGKRFGALAGEGLANQCVASETNPTDSASATLSSSTDSEGSSGSSTTTTPGTGTGPGTTDPTTTTTTNSTNPSTTGTTTGTTGTTKSTDTTDPTNPTTDPTDPSGSSTTGEVEEKDPYGPCSQLSDCNMGDICVETPPYGYCATPCNDVNDCPLPLGLANQPSCQPCLMGPGSCCVIECPNNDDLCLDGMICAGFFCTWIQ